MVTKLRVNVFPSVPKESALPGNAEKCSATTIATIGLCRRVKFMRGEREGLLSDYKPLLLSLVSVCAHPDRLVVASQAEIALLALVEFEMWIG
ncbi:MAG TPA: hypothetical protein VNT26_19925, partial [Candidatus Sulfotelmatobacter sp.]|nr:hypothetical protein [Candidatus Sulfotelmatobacter sp.]